jgi:hypothetical protein
MVSGVLAGGIVFSCLEGRKAEVMEIEEGALWGSGLGNSRSREEVPLPCLLC